jgi:hypothetical protein
MCRVRGRASMTMIGLFETRQSWSGFGLYATAQEKGLARYTQA